MNKLINFISPLGVSDFFVSHAGSTTCGDLSAETHFYKTIPHNLLREFQKKKKKSIIISKTSKDAKRHFSSKNDLNTRLISLISIHANIRHAHYVMPLPATEAQLMITHFLLSSSSAHCPSLRSLAPNDSKRFIWIRSFRRIALIQTAVLKKINLWQNLSSVIVFFFFLLDHFLLLLSSRFVRKAKGKLKVWSGLCHVSEMRIRMWEKVDCVTISKQFFVLFQIQLVSH